MAAGAPCAALLVNQRAQHCEDGRHALHFVQHKRAGAGGETAFDLELRVVGKQLVHVGLFQVHIRRGGERGAGERGLVHLARAYDEHGRKLAGEAARAWGMEAIPHTPYFGSGDSKIKAKPRACADGRRLSFDQPHIVVSRRLVGDSDLGTRIAR